MVRKGLLFKMPNKGPKSPKKLKIAKVKVAPAVPVPDAEALAAAITARLRGIEAADVGDPFGDRGARIFHYDLMTLAELKRANSNGDLVLNLEKTRRLLHSFIDLWNDASGVKNAARFFEPDVLNEKTASQAAARVYVTFLDGALAAVDVRGNADLATLALCLLGRGKSPAAMPGPGTGGGN